MRLFTAINFSPETKNGLVALCDELRVASSRGRFSLPENLHLTLAFLGECDTKQTAAAKLAMDSISFAPFELMIDSIGQFKRNGGDIWWAGLRENRGLLILQQNLTDKLRNAGLKFDERKFSPHITLGREIITKTRPRQIEPFGETVTKIELMKSERIGGKLTYTAIHIKGSEKYGDNKFIEN
jgi:2'-5' RNA ligase